MYLLERSFIFSCPSSSNLKCSFLCPFLSSFICLLDSCPRPLIIERSPQTLWDDVEYLSHYYHHDTVCCVTSLIGRLTNKCWCFRLIIQITDSMPHQLVSIEPFHHLLHNCILYLQVRPYSAQFAFIQHVIYQSYHDTLATTAGISRDTSDNEPCYKLECVIILYARLFLSVSSVSCRLHCAYVSGFINISLFLAYDFSIYTSLPSTGLYSLEHFANA